MTGRSTTTCASHDNLGRVGFITAVAAMGGFLFGCMTVAPATEAWAFASLHGGTLPHAQGVVALIAAHAFVFFFAMFWGVVLWMMLGEMFRTA
jgi:hypothetical protein